MNAETHSSMQRADEGFELNDVAEIHEDPVQNALHEWQKAASEWSEAYRRTCLNTKTTRTEQSKKLRKLEKRLNKAADNYQKAKSEDHALTGGWWNSRPKQSSP